VLQLIYKPRQDKKAFFRKTFPYCLTPPPVPHAQNPARGGADLLRAGRKGRAKLSRQLRPLAYVELPNHPVTPKGQKYALYLVENIDIC